LYQVCVVIAEGELVKIGSMHLKKLKEEYLGKAQESGFQEYLRYCLSGLPYFWQSNSGSIKGQLEES